MKVETHPPLCLAVVGIRRREIAVQVRDRNLYTTNRQNDSEARSNSCYLYNLGCEFNAPQKSVTRRYFISEGTLQVPISITNIIVLSSR